RRSLPEVRRGQAVRDPGQGSVRDVAPRCDASDPAGAVMRAAIAPACALIAASLAAVVASAAPVDDDRLANATIVYVRGTSVLKADARGKGEVELAQLPAKTTVRAMRTDS